ncbi:hypothetical protein [Undibacterium sp.]|jgi:UDPglucose--hexose-1-phosphate uridylyltransferase|uniref:hypothetical protein n=1 Tax=Undibacterium sp. TaxID=1914977 RepID=UPI002C9055E7|nr:hypothetical protein [Undibacterium sp.]HTD02471.1 hypothetical protein [Undibacterium sp.]
MNISFKAEKKLSSLLDPRRQFAFTQIESEIRYDPLTQDTARICHFAGVVPQSEDLTDLLESTRALCPFCGPQVGTVTPKFTADFLSGFHAAGSAARDGRLVRGEATLFPNLFPYDEISAIAAISREHALDAKAMPAQVIADAIMLARDFFKHARQASDQLAGAYGLLTWNYLPASGGSQLHPHMQVALTQHPGNRLARELTAESAYLSATGNAYASDLIEAERDGARWLMEDAAASWIVPFAPIGALGDVTAIFRQHGAIEELGDAEIMVFSGALSKMIAYFANNGLSSFNLSFFPDIPTDESGRHRLTARLLPRFYLNNALHVSDASYLQLLLQESFCMRFPEVLAEQMRKAL